MKPRHLEFTLLALAAAACLALAVACSAAWFTLRQATSRRIEYQQIRTTCFLGYTNGVVGPIALHFITNSAQNSIVQQWYAAGRNAGLFTVTNDERMPIRLYPCGRFYTQGPLPLNETTLLLDAPSFNGFHLQSGQSITFQVPVFPHPGPWRLLLFYERVTGPMSLRDTLNGLIAILGARMRGVPDPLPPQRKQYQVYSDWIAK